MTPPRVPSPHRAARGRSRTILVSRVQTSASAVALKSPEPANTTPPSALWWVKARSNEPSAVNATKVEASQSTTVVAGATLSRLPSATKPARARLRTTTAALIGTITAAQRRAQVPPRLHGSPRLSMRSVAGVAAMRAPSAPAPTVAPNRESQDSGSPGGASPEGGGCEAPLDIRSEGIEGEERRVPEEIVGEGKCVGRVGREPAKASRLRSGKPSVENGPQRGTLHPERRPAARGSHLRVSIPDLDGTRRRSVNDEVECSVRRVPPRFDGPLDVEEAQHRSRHEGSQGVLHPFRPVPQEIDVDEGTIDGIVCFHLEGHFAHLIALRTDERKQPAATGLVVRDEIVDVEPRLGVRLGLAGRPTQVSRHASLLVQDKPSPSLVEKAPLPESVRAIEPAGVSLRGSLIRRLNTGAIFGDGRPHRPRRARGIAPGFRNGPRVKHEQPRRRHRHVPVARVKALTKRVQKRQRVAARMSPQVELVEQGTGKGLAPRFRRHAHARDSSRADPSPSEPESELEQESVSQDEPAALGHVEAIE